MNPSLAAIPVLLYHAVTREPSNWIAPYAVTPDDFARQLDLVVASGRTALTIEELRLGLSGELAMPERPVAITFDDGFADNLDIAAPLLDQRRLPSTVYVTTGFVGGTSPGGDKMLGWSGAEALAAAGHQIGAHSVTHRELDTLPLAALRREVVASRFDLQDRLGLPIHSFAYPHGHHSSTVVREVEAAGFESACAVKNALSHHQDSPYAIARLTVGASTPDQHFQQWLDGRGAPLSWPGEHLVTRGWRCYRRIRSHV